MEICADQTGPSIRKESLLNKRSVKVKDRFTCTSTKPPSPSHQRKTITINANSLLIITSWSVKVRANGRNITVQQLPTLLGVTCCVRLHTLLHVVACCWELLREVLNWSNFCANNYMLRPFAHPVACCWELLREV